MMRRIGFVTGRAAPTGTLSSSGACAKSTVALPHSSPSYTPPSTFTRPPLSLLRTTFSPPGAPHCCPPPPRPSIPHRQPPPSSSLFGCTTPLRCLPMDPLALAAPGSPALMDPLGDVWCKYKRRARPERAWSDRAKGGTGRSMLTHRLSAPPLSSPSSAPPLKPRLRPSRPPPSAHPCRCRHDRCA
jgi:hypothetical protein